jgi:hypothetical protein
MLLSMKKDEIAVILHFFSAFCHSERSEESSRNISVILEKTGFFVGKPPQNDRKKQVSHYPVIVMERIVQCPCVVSYRVRAARNDGEL